MFKVRTRPARQLVRVGAVLMLTFAIVSETAAQPITSVSDRPVSGEYRLSFRGQIDGSEIIELSDTHAWWTHRNWGWPSQPVWLGYVRWNPKQKRFIENSGHTRYLPPGVDFSAARLANVKARDKVTLEPGPRSVRVHIVDTPNGGGQYQFDIVFPVRVRRTSIHITADIDGSDTLILTRKGAEWKHHRWSWPNRVLIDDVSWKPKDSPRLKRIQWSLPKGVDLTAARLTVNKARDAAVMECFKDRIVIHFADNPLGRATYDLAIDWPLPRLAPVEDSSPQPQAATERSYRIRAGQSFPFGQDPGANQVALERIVRIGTPFEFKGAHDVRFSGIVTSGRAGGLFLKATLTHNRGTSEFDSTIKPGTPLRSRGGISSAGIITHFVELTSVEGQRER